MHEDIAFPLDYKAPISFAELRKAEKITDENLREFRRVDDLKNRGKSYKAMLHVELAKNLLDPNKLSEIHNSFMVYKLKG